MGNKTNESVPNKTSSTKIILLIRSMFSLAGGVGAAFGIAVGTAVGTAASPHILHTLGIERPSYLQSVFQLGRYIGNIENANLEGAKGSIEGSVIISYEVPILSKPTMYLLDKAEKTSYTTLTERKEDYIQIVNRIYEDLKP